MNRHHPYGGFDNGPRRGGHAGGPGPERFHPRFSDRGGRGRGYGRGRGFGAAASHDAGYGHGHANYSQSAPSGDPNLYNNADSSQTQHPYYQNNNYGGGLASNVSYPTAGSNDYNEAYDNYGDDEGFQGENGFGRGGKRFPRAPRDDKVHDSIITERIQRERPCRTLFIRNIKYETDSADVRRRFEEHGEVKTFFDLISTRGMVFVTYFDLRDAERARERLQGSEISGRPIDVHYSLPREDHSKGNDNSQHLVGCMIVSLRNSATGVIDDNELRRLFSTCGDIKNIRPTSNDRPDQRYVEFYDLRACHESFSRLRHQPLQDGVMEVSYGWDENDESSTGGHGANAGGAGGGGWEHRGMKSRGRGGFRHRGRGRGGGGGGGGFDDDFERRDFGHRRGHFDDDFRGSGRGGRGGFGDRFGHRGGAPSGPSNPGYSNEPTGPAYSNAPSGYDAPDYGNPQAPPQPPSEGDRLEQARKVQQLLAALKQPQNPTPPGPGSAGPVPPPPVPGAPYNQPPPPNPNPYYSGAPPPYPPVQPGYPPVPPPPGAYPVMQPPPVAAPPLPPSNAYGSPRQPSTPQPPAAASLAGLPPNIMALLQQNMQASPPPQGPNQPRLPLPPQAAAYGVVPPAGMTNTPPPGAGGGAPPGVTELMAYLQQAQGGGK